MAKDPMKANRNSPIFICALLAISVLIVYGQVGKFDFIRYDEELYVTKNPHVLSGMSLDGLLWAFTTLDAGNWHPLTWLSLMLDRELYGMNAGGYHWTSVVLHLLSGLLLFFTFSRMTGHPWRSGLLAGLFLIHPLHVESVAWVAERKDVLSGLFWMLSMWGYARYAERPGAGRYLQVVLFFAMGLMSKPMVVTLPFVLLLLDYWPLGRISLGHDGTAVGGEIDSSEGLKSGSTRVHFPKTTVFRLILEKIPLLFLSFFSAFLTWKAQKAAGALLALVDLPLLLRLTNALISYARYLDKTVWPVHLSFFYPHPAGWPYWQVFLAGSVLILISIWTWRQRKSCPYLAMGWLWFLGALIPVIGLVQAGSQAMADRYVYIPFIGLSIMVVWGSYEALNWQRYQKILLSAVWGVILLTLMLTSFRQAQYWRNSVTLFKHAIEATDRNYLAHNNYGAVLMDQKNYHQATEHFLESLRIKPDFAEAHNNMGNIMALQGKNEEAAVFFREAIRIKPDYAGAKRRLGDVLQRMGKSEEAIICYREALIRNPDDPVLHNNIAVALASAGKGGEAVYHLRKALDLKAGYGDAQKNLDIMTKRIPFAAPQPARREDFEEGGR